MITEWLTCIFIDWPNSFVHFCEVQSDMYCCGYIKSYYRGRNAFHSYRPHMATEGLLHLCFWRIESSEGSAHYIYSLFATRIEHKCTAVTTSSG